MQPGQIKTQLVMQASLLPAQINSIATEAHLGPCIKALIYIAFGRERNLLSIRHA